MRSNSISRRAFLSRATVLAAAPYIVSARALGRAPGRLAASERLTIGMIGVGNMGSGHFETFLGNSEVEIVAICDVDAVKRDKYAQRASERYGAEKHAGTHGGVQTYNEYEELLARPDIDAVLIAVPDHWHATIAAAACRAGKDVYCEKPLTLTIREAQRIVQVARQTNRVFQTGSQQRSSPEFRIACELVRNERIGKLQEVKVNIGPPSAERYLPAEPVRPGFDWNRWLGPATYQPYNATRCSGDYGGGWRFIRDYSGGMTTDWGAHHFDIVQWALGMDGNGPVRVDPPAQRFDYGLKFTYDSGVTVTRAPDVNGILFVGSTGKVEVNRGYLKTWPDTLQKDPIGPNEVRLYESPGHHQDWFNCIRSRRRPICDVAVGASSVTMCHLGNLAYWLERPIRWDPEKGEIIDDGQASRWLDRPRRAPWTMDA